jgi:uncharacterized phiE125 gp8 family phage protein
MIVDDRLLRPAAFPRGLDPARVTVVTAPTVEPWLVADDEVQQMLRLDSDADSTYITHLIQAARLHLERATGLALVHQTLKATFDRTPAGPTLDLPRAPLSSISNIKYLDTDGAEQTFSSSAYSAKDVGVAGAFGRVALNPDYDWPEVGDYRGAFYVTYVAGFGAAATAIPADLRLAVLWLAAWWYEARLPVGAGNGANELPHHLAALIDAHRVTCIG